MKRFLFVILFCNLFLSANLYALTSSTSSELKVLSGIYEAMEKLNIPVKDTTGIDRISKRCRDIFHRVIIIKDGRVKIAHNIPEILMEIESIEKNLNASSKDSIAENRALLFLSKAILENNISKNIKKLDLEAIKNREMYLFCRLITSLALFYEGVMQAELQRVAAYATLDYSNQDSFVENASKEMIKLIEESNSLAPQKRLKERTDKAGNRLFGNYYGIYYGLKNKLYAKSYYSLFVNNGEPTYNYYNFSYMEHAIETFYLNKEGEIIHQPLFIKNIIISNSIFILELCSDPFLNGNFIDSKIKVRFLDKDKIEMVDSLQDGKSIYIKEINNYVFEPNYNIKLGEVIEFNKVTNGIPAYFSSYDKRFITKPYKKISVGDINYIIYISFIEAPSSIHKENIQTNIIMSFWKEDINTKKLTLSSTAFLGSGGYLTDCELESNAITCRVFDRKNMQDKSDDNIVANYYKLQLKAERLILTNFSSKAKINGEKFQQIHFNGEMDASSINNDILKELYKPYF